MPKLNKITLAGDTFNRDPVTCDRCRCPLFNGDAAYEHLETDAVFCSPQCWEITTRVSHALKSIAIAWEAGK